MKQDTIAWSIAGVIVIILVIIAIILSVHKHHMIASPTAGAAVTPSSQTGSTQTAGATTAGTTVQPNGSDIVRTVPSNTGVSSASDLVTFSIAPGSHILSGIVATGTIDPSYVSDGKITIELADQNYNLIKTVTGTVTGTAPENNVTFSATIDTNGVATGGVGYIIFRQVSGNRYVSIPVVFDK